MDKLMSGSFLRVVFGIALAMGVVSNANAFMLNFDENGNGTFTADTGAVSSLAGTLMNDPSSSLGNVLTYLFPNGVTVGNGDVGVYEYGSTSEFSDGIRFTDANGNLNGATADRMIFYSDIDPLPVDLADTGLPSNFGTGTTGGPVTEDINGYFTYNIGNVYTGYSPDTAVPEPMSLALLGIGMAGIGITRLRKR
jgi:PEP-CTERM motif